MCRRDFHSGTATKKYAPHLIIQPVHLDARLNFDLKQRRIMGEVSFVLKHAGCAPIAGQSDRLELNAVAFSSVSVSGALLSSFKYDAKVLKLHWESPFQPSESRVVTVKYVVERPVTGMFFSGYDGQEAGRPLYAISDHETERARYWLPCIDFPAVRQTLSFAITAPKHLIALANGQLEKEEVSGDLKTTFWKLEQTCPSYLICLAVGEFERVDDTPVENMPIAYFAPRGTPHDNMRRSFDKTPSMVRWLQQKLDSKFPWPKYFQIVAPEVGGAMENISLVTWNDRFLLDETWAKERKHIMDSVNIHEMAHTYFGDLITIRHFEHVWMKESWATYMESVWMQDNINEDTFRYEMLCNLDDYVSETKSYMRPMVIRRYDSSWTMFDHHTYPGGAWRIHMLRKLVGDNTFWTCVRKYVTRYRGKSAETDDFRKVFEEETGLNLTRFFDEWWYSKGFINLKVGYEFNSEKACAKFTLEQTQVDAAKEIPLFHMAVDVEVVDEAGKTYSGTAFFEDEDTKQFLSITLPKDAKPSYVRIDPEGKLLMSLDFNPGEELLFNIATKAADLVTRSRAYLELVKVGTYQALKKLQEGVLKEPFYGVRVKVADALSESRTRHALDVLIAMLDNEKHPMAMWQLAKACKVRDSAVRSALKRFLERTDLPYRAREFAIDSLGYQIQDEDLGALMSIAKDEKQLGYHNFVRAGVLRALSNYTAPEVFQYLLKRVRDNDEPYRLARPTAVTALARCAMNQERRDSRTKAIRAILDLVMRSPDEDVRRSAIQGLIILEAKQTAGDVAETKMLYAEQDWPWLEKKVKAIQESGTAGSATKGVEEKIEKLEAQVRKLQDALEKIQQQQAEVGSKSGTAAGAVAKETKARQMNHTNIYTAASEETISACHSIIPETAAMPHISCNNHTDSSPLSASFDQAPTAGHKSFPEIDTLNNGECIAEGDNKGEAKPKARFDILTKINSKVRAIKKLLKSPFSAKVENGKPGKNLNILAPSKSCSEDSSDETNCTETDQAKVVHQKRGFKIPFLNRISDHSDESKSSSWWSKLKFWSAKNAVKSEDSVVGVQHEVESEHAFSVHVEEQDCQDDQESTHGGRSNIKTPGLNPDRPHVIDWEVLKQMQEVLKDSIMEEKARLPVGLAEKYEIVGFLNEGTYGTVFEAAVKEHPQERVVIKVVHKDAFQEDDWVSDEVFGYIPFEIHLLKELSHPHIISLVDLYQDHNFFYIVTELFGEEWHVGNMAIPAQIRYNGMEPCQISDIAEFEYRSKPYPRDLYQCFQVHTKFPEHVIQVILAQIGDALSYMHSCGVVHGDIKLENVLIDANYKVKIIDFGAASLGHSQTGRVEKIAGTPNFISIEQIGGCYDESADAWSLGVIAYILQFRRFPYASDDHLLAGDIKMPSFSKSQCNTALYNLISGLLDLDPESRIHCDELYRQPFFCTL